MTEPAQPADSRLASSAREIGARIAHGLIAVTAIVVLVLVVVHGMSLMNAVLLTDLFTRHGPAVIGVPVATLVATALLSGLRAIDGRFQVGIISLRFEGAAASLLGRLAIFFTIVIAFRALW